MNIQENEVDQDKIDQEIDRLGEYSNLSNEFKDLFDSFGNILAINALSYIKFQQSKIKDLEILNKNIISENESFLQQRKKSDIVINDLKNKISKLENLNKKLIERTQNFDSKDYEIVYSIVNKLRYNLEFGDMCKLHHQLLNDFFVGRVNDIINKQKEIDEYKSIFAKINKFSKK